MRFLRTNTAVIITVGPFYDKTDGVTIETALTITNERITLTADTDAGSAPTNILDNIAGATSGTANDLNYITGNDAGMMQMELAAADVNRLGRMFLSITDAANHVPVFHEFMVVNAALYDAFFASSGGAIPNVAAAAAGGLMITGGSNAGTTTLAALTVTGATVHTGNVSYADGITVAVPSTSNRAGIDTAGNGTGPGIRATGGATGDGVRAVGGATSGDGVDASAATLGHGINTAGAGNGGNGVNAASGAGTTGSGINASAGSTNGYGIRGSGSGGNSGISGVGGATGNGVEAIGGATSGSGAFFSAGGKGHGAKFQGVAGVGAGDDEGHGIRASGGANDVNDGIRALAPSASGVPIRGNITGNITGNLSGSVATVTDGATAANLAALDTKVVTIDDFLDTEVAAILAAVDTEVASILALLDDARTEPGQGNPPVNPDVVTKVDYLYKWMRNKKDNDGSTTKFYADDGSTVDQKQTTSSAGGTVTKGEIATGP